MEFDDDVAPAEMNAEAPARVERETEGEGPQGYVHCALGDVREHLDHPNDWFEIYNGSRWRRASLTEVPKVMRVTMTFEVETREREVEDGVGLEIAEMVRKAFRSRDGHGYYKILSLQDIHAPSYVAEKGG